MWTKEQALNFVISNCVPLLSESGNVCYQHREDLLEEWDNGWIFHFSPQSGNGYRERFVVEKHLEKGLLVGTYGIGRTIERIYRKYGRTNTQ
jgi:hypothetical protein